MKLAPRVIALFVLMLVAVGGLTLPGIPGTVAAYAWLGVFPGLAVARLIAPRGTWLVRWTLGLALAPLVSSLAGWAMLSAGQPLETTARVVGIAGWLLFASSEARIAAAHTDDPDAAPASRFVIGWMLACAAFVVIPPLVNPWIRIQSDTWIHLSLVREIQHHGVPPQDPRFAGLPLNYVWLYNLFVAMAASLRGQDPVAIIVVFNVLGMATMIVLVWQIAWMLWRDARAAAGAVALYTVGLNAGAWLLWPLKLARALQGDVRGWDEVQRQIQNTQTGSTAVLYELSAPYGWMVNFWDKWTLGTSLGYAYGLLLVYFWAFARWLAAGDPRWLAAGALAAAGMLFMHGVVGLSVLPVSLGALALAALLRARLAWLPEPRRIAAFAGATLVAMAAATPYTIAISRGWDPRTSGLVHHYLQPGWMMPWTIVTALAVPWLLLPAGLRALAAARSAFGAWLAIWALGMLAFSLVVHLPEGNEHKFVFQLLISLALLGGAAFPRALAATRQRLGTPAWALLAALLFVVPSVLFQVGYARDPRGREAPAIARQPGEDALYRWMRTTASEDAVFTDHHSRDLVMVLGERRLLAGTAFGPERAAFPLLELLQRRRRMADLYAVDPAAPLHTDSLAATMAPLGGAVLHVLYRPEDWRDGARPWARLDADSSFQLEYDRDGFRVYAFRP